MTWCIVQQLISCQVAGPLVASHRRHRPPEIGRWGSETVRIWEISQPGCQLFSWGNQEDDVFSPAARYFIYLLVS